MSIYVTLMRHQNTNTTLVVDLDRFASYVGRTHFNIAHRFSHVDLKNYFDINIQSNTCLYEYKNVLTGWFKAELNLS